MAELKDLIIKTPQAGISSSPHFGNADIRNIDISSIPGTAQMNNVADKKSSTTIDGQPYWIIQDPNTPADFYCLDAAGVLYKSDDWCVSWAEISDRGGTGQGLAIWKDYVFVFEDTKIDVYGPLSGAAAWTDNWATIGSATWHPTKVSQNDGNLYFGCGRYVGYISEESGQDFAPGTSATYDSTLGTSASNSLDLPEDFEIKCMEELGNNLMLGTYRGSETNRTANIFSWDRSSVSFGQPIITEEYSIHAMKNINQQLYFLAGNQGKVYKSNGVQTWAIAQIPDYITSLKDSALKLEGYPGAICKYKGKLYFGIGSDSAVDGMGVYSVQETSGGTILNLEHGISTGNWGASNKLQVSALCPITDESISIGWIDNTTTGVDKTLVSGNKYAYGTDYSDCYWESPFYTVGTNLNKRQFTQLEFQLAEDIATDEGIKVEYRISLDDSFTEIGSYTNSDFTGTSHHIEPGIVECEFIQIRTSIKGKTTTPKIKSITLR